MPENKFHKINHTILNTHLALINEGRKPSIGSQFDSQEGQEGAIDWGEMWSSMGADNFNRVLNTIGIPMALLGPVGDAYDATTAGIFGARALGEKDPETQKKHAADAAYAGIAAVPGVGEVARWGRIARALGSVAPTVTKVAKTWPVKYGAPVAGMAAHSALWPDEPDKTHQKTPGADQSIMDTKNIGSMVDFLTKSNIPGSLGNYSRSAALPGPLTWSGNQSLAASYERVATGIVQNLNEARLPVRPSGMPARTWERIKGALAFLAAPAGVAALAAIAGPVALGALGKESQEGEIALGDKGESGAGGAQTAVSRLASVTGYIPQFNPAAAGLQALARRAGGLMA